MRITKIVIIFLSLFIGTSLYAGETSHLFQNAFEAVGNPSEVFKPGAEWATYPKYSDRDGWAKFAYGRRKAMIAAGEKVMGCVWDDGDFSKAACIPAKENITKLFIAEMSEGKGRFLPDIERGLRHIVDRYTWRDKNFTKKQNPATDIILDLHSSAYGHNLAIIWYYLRDVLDPELEKDIRKALKRNVFDVYFDDSKIEEMYWQGFCKPYKNAVINNWNPYCNFHIAVAFLFAQQDPKLLVKGLEKICRSVDKYISFIPDDGCCDEGPGYWGMAGGKVYELAQLLYDASGGRFNVFSDAKLRRMGEWRTKVEIGNNWSVNFSDCSPHQGSGGLIPYCYGKAIGSEEMVTYGLYKMINKKGDGYSSPKVKYGGGVLYEALWTLDFVSKNSALFKSPELTPDEIAKRYQENSVPVYYPESDQAYIRTKPGLFLAAKGGHNSESHNHNDVGNCIFFAAGNPVLVDLGVNHNTYGRVIAVTGIPKYEIFSVNSDYHNCPAPNGVKQSPGRDFAASGSSCDPVKGLYYMDIAGAYSEDAACSSLKRVFTIAGSKMSITDAVELSSRIAPDAEYFMTPCEVKEVKPGELLLTYKETSVRLRYSKNLKFSLDVVDLVQSNSSLPKYWGPTINRLVFKSAADAPLKNTYKFEFYLNK